MTTGNALVIVHQTARRVRDNDTTDTTELSTALDIVEDLIVNEYPEEIDSEQNDEN